MVSRKQYPTYYVGEYNGQTLKSVKTLTLDPRNMSELSVFVEQIRAARDLVQALRHELGELAAKVNSMKVTLTMIVHIQPIGAWRGRWRVKYLGKSRHVHWDDLGIILDSYPKKVRELFTYANDRAHQLYIQESISLNIIRMTNEYLEGRLTRKPKGNTMSVEEMAKMLAANQAPVNPGTKTK